MPVILDSNYNTASLDEFLAELRLEVLPNFSSDAVDLFNTFAQEARVCRSWLDASVHLLPAGSSILEVGAGLMLVACQLQREGFLVTALEPIGPGFSIFAQLQKGILAYAERKGFAPAILPIAAENLDTQQAFSLAYSFNVMEHVTDVPSVLIHVINSLKDNGKYQFVCPNYLFPYEPHFNIPTLFSKKLTALVFKRRIHQANSIPDPNGLWSSLNWISVLQVRHILEDLHSVSFQFKKEYFMHTLERLTCDKEFASRRSGWLSQMLIVFVKLGLHRLAPLIPAAAQPVIDCHILVGRKL